jgi:anti-sigma factor RsiW
MEFSCKEAVPLIGAYLDGELSAPQAALLRQHLLDCHVCRNATQDGKTLKRWFAPLVAEAHLASAVGAPPGFASRVARRAFAGDTGERASTSTRPGRPQEDRVLTFVVGLTAVAAAVALVFALAAGSEKQPAGSHLAADDRTAMPIVQIQSELERLNREALAAGSQAGEVRR